MPDTGAPWNIPYVENADLVSDWPADSLLVANAVAAGLTDAQNAGIGSNVVQTVKTDAFSTSSTSFTALTGMSVNITPTLDTSKVLIFVQTNISASTGSTQTFRLRRGSTTIAESTAGGVSNGFDSGSPGVSNNDTVQKASTVFLDSPTSDAVITYSVEVRTNAGTMFVNRSANNADYGAVSTITVIEVAA